MPKDAPPATTGRRRRPLLALAALAAVLVATPRVTHPGLVPTDASRPALAAPDDLRQLLAGILREEDAQPVPADGHAMRADVTPHAVRLAVDRNAVHPLSGPVAVRQTGRLGGPGQRLRLVTLAAPEPAPQPTPTVVAAATPVAATPAAVKILSPQPPPAAKTAAAAPGRSVLVAGDSLSLFLADALRPMLAGRPGTTFAARGKVSSGLARPDFFNWEREMETLAAANRPDTVVVMIATNDNQTLTRPDGVKVGFGRPGWDIEYARRVRRIVELARGGTPGARVYWLGAPVMADAKLNADVAAINAVIARQLAVLPGCRFVDVSRTLADAAGRYVSALPAPGGTRAARTRDGVHLTPYGATLLAHAALSSMSPAVAELQRP
jgi:hypothetical protein